MDKDTFLVIGEGESLAPYVDKVKELAEKNIDNVIGVNRIPLVFPCKYWVFMDNNSWLFVKDNVQPHHQVVCSRTAANCIHARQHPEINKIETKSNTCNSGLAAITWAFMVLEAKKIITIGIDFTKEWKKYNGAYRHPQSDQYINSIRSSMEKLRKNHEIYCLNPNNPMNLPHYDIDSLI